MKRKIRLLRVLPFLAKLFEWFVPKLLNFTDFPQVEGNTRLLIEERNAYFRSALNPVLSDKWNLSIVKLIKSKYISDIKLVRIGSENDGGYFVPESFLINQIWVSIGLGHNVEFENDLASRNCEVTCFDHTIDGRPKQLNKNVNYIDKGWGSKNEVSSKSSLISLNRMVSLASNNTLNFNADWCLKFDIEGNEWKCLDQLAQIRNKPAVIVCELHGLLWGSPLSKSSKVKELLQFLLKDYFICYFNGNNYSPYLNTNKYALYDIAEFTLIQKKFTSRKITTVHKARKIESKNNILIEQMPIR